MMRIVHKLTALYCLLGASVLAVYGTLTIQRERAMFERTVRDDALLTAQAIGSALERVWNAEGRRAAEEALREAPGGAERIVLELALRDEVAASAEERAELGAGRAVSRLVQGDPALIRVLQPLRVQGAVAPVLVLQESLQRERLYLSRSVALVAGTTAALLLTLGLASFAIGRLVVGQPVGALVLKARRVGSGDLGGPVEVRQRDEIGELAVAMNDMCGRLSDEIEARLQAQSELRHAERLKLIGQLAAGVAHERGTPLNVVLGRSLMIVEHPTVAPDVAAAARVVVTQTERMCEIVRQLLDFGRRGKRVSGPVDMEALVHETVTLLRPLARASGVTLEAQPVEGCSLQGDAEHLRQALTNIVINGIHAMPEGGRLLVSLARADAHPPGAQAPVPCIALAVEDEGVGIAPEDLQRVFEPFFTTKPLGEGTGLGLSVAHGIVSDHGGWISVESRPGRGSRFTVHLPVEGSP